MSPVPLKRRKLDNGRNGDTTRSKSGSDDDREGSASDAESQTGNMASNRLPPTKPLKHKAVDGNSAAYAGESYKSGLFKLQVDELLSEVQPNYEKRLRGVDDALRRLKGLIEGIKAREPVPAPEATMSLQKSHKISIPFPNPKPDKHAAYKFAYTKPSNINVVGSYALKTMVKSDSTFSIDMVVVMPPSIFQEKDYLNYRYFYKRAYYLACIHVGLEISASAEFDIGLEYLHGNDLHPILIAKPKPCAGQPRSDSSFEIRIIPAAPPSCFSDGKLRLNKNAIRPKDTSSTESSNLVATPFYNSSITSDSNYEQYLKVLHSSANNSSGFKESCILGRTWLRQRGLDSQISSGGFGHFEWAAMTALLLNGGGPKGHNVLSPGYSSYQMFKAMLQFISTHDLLGKPFFYESEEVAFQALGMPVFFDGPRGHNILYKMTPWSYNLLQEEAKASLSMLNDANFDPFDSTFILRACQPLQRFDCTFKISSPEKEGVSLGDHCSKAKSFSARLYEVLRQGLMDRVKLVYVQDQHLSRMPSIPSSDTVLLVSVIFDSANIDRLVDHGPAAEEKKQAAYFQKFWGEKAELRRFKDGSILESLVWSPGSTYAIFGSIVSYLVTRHFGNESANSLKFVGEGFAKQLPGSGKSSNHFETLRQAFKTFEKQVRDLESLPLQLRSLSATGPSLRSSTFESPLFSSTRPLETPSNVIIQFEGSGRWPDDVVAIQRTKIAFLLKIGTLLSEKHSGITTRLGLENEDLLLRNCAFLDVIYDSGATFRLRIHNDREQGLLERQVKNKSLDQRTRDDAVTALAVYKKDFSQLPLLTQSISTHCTRFPLLSSTIRLVKMWFNSHMLSRHVGEEFIELLVTRTFLQPYPWRAPSSAMTGLLRTLIFLSKWDWRSTPLIVDFSGIMTTKEAESVKTRLEAWRKIDPAMNQTVVFAATNHDTTGTAFTDHGPSKLAAARMTALARSACKIVKDKGLELDPMSLFTTSTTDYDFVIHLSSKFRGRSTSKDSEKPKFKNLEVQSEKGLEGVGYNPVQSYRDDLERLYAANIVFFHDCVSGSLIAGLWNPQSATPRPFKVNLPYANRPVSRKDDNEEEVVFDKSTILAEIGRLGGDMVSRIEVLK